MAAHKESKMRQSLAQEAQDWVISLIKKGEDGLGAEFVTITPDRAEALLSVNPNNRKLRPTKVDQYAKDMREGRFKTNGESIIFAKTGELNDGQNRLSAIVKSGVSQLMLLAWGLERDSRFTVDIGAARSAGDTLGLMGIIYGPTLAAAARRILAVKSTGSPQNGGRMSTPEITTMANTDQLLLEVGQWSHTHQSKFRAMKLPASEVAVVFYLLSEVAPKQARVFMESFRDGVHLDADSPIMVLRTKLLNSPKLNNGNRFEATIRAWNNWIRDQKTTSIPISGKYPEIKKPINARKPNQQEG